MVEAKNALCLYYRNGACETTGCLFYTHGSCRVNGKLSENESSIERSDSRGNGSENYNIH